MKRQKPPALDGRTRESRKIKEITAELTQNPRNAAKALLKGIIARNAVIEREIYNRALTEGTLFDENGKLSEMIEKTLLKYQNASKSALTELLKLDGGKPDAEEDIFDGVFDGC